MEVTLERIESYIRGELTDEVENQLWEYLTELEWWYEHFDTLLRIAANTG